MSIDRKQWINRVWLIECGIKNTDMLINVLNRLDRNTSIKHFHQQWRNKQEIEWICWFFYKMIIDKTNEHNLNRSQKQLIETPDSQINRGFQYTIPFDRFLTTLSIVYHVKMLVIQCFWAIQFQAQLWKNIIVCYTITIDSNRRLSPFNTQYKSNNGIHSRSLPLYLCLFNITILWDYPVQSSSFTW